MPGAGAAPRVHRKVYGVDFSPYLIAVATRLAAEQALDRRIDFRVADTRSLDFPSGQFDAVIAHTLMSHVDDPLAAIKEAVRVLKPGGVIGIFDGDYASLTFGHPNPTQAKPMMRRSSTLSSPTRA